MCAGLTYFLKNYLTETDIVDKSYIGFNASGVCSTFGYVTGKESLPRIWDPTYTNESFKCKAS